MESKEVELISGEAVAWYWMAEGSVHVGIKGNKKVQVGYSAEPIITFSNNDIEQLDCIGRWFKVVLGANGSMVERQRKNSYMLAYSGYKVVYSFSNEIYDYLVGVKKEIIDLILELCEGARPTGFTLYSLDEARRYFLGIMRFHDRIIALRPIPHPVKYTEKYFEEMWYGKS